MGNIPKYIHYCWFGKGSIPKSNLKYIEGWKKIFPDYKLILWNEDNFPLDNFSYAKEAYNAGKYAFVSDVARIYALNKMGGIYLDTDVEVLRNPETLFSDKSLILGSESVEAQTMGTGFIASSPNHKISNKMLEYYSKCSFLNNDGTMNIKSNTKLMTEMMLECYGIGPSLEIQNVDDAIVFPRKYFTAFNTVTKRPEISSETYCVHHFDASWFSIDKKIKRYIKQHLARLTSRKNR